MMKKLAISFILVSVMVLMLGTSALADTNAPVGGCPDNFHLHHMMDHDHHNHHMHQHVGNDADQNGDGYLCVKHVGNGVGQRIHVHIDNHFPLN